MKSLKVIILSIIGLFFLGLTFFIDWIFIIGAILIVYLNQKEIIKNKNNKKKKKNILKNSKP